MTAFLSNENLQSRLGTESQPPLSGELRFEVDVCTFPPQTFTHPAPGIDREWGFLVRRVQKAANHPKVSRRPTSPSITLSTAHRGRYPCACARQGTFTPVRHVCPKYIFNSDRTRPLRNHHLLYNHYLSRCRAYEELRSLS